MTTCETTDFVFPMQASIYYPIVDQGNYGSITKQWVLDKTIACSFTSGGSSLKEEVRVDINIIQGKVLAGRTKNDPRISSQENKNALTNILITDIRDQNGTVVYIETSGPRSGKGTLFELATISPLLGPFGTIEYYNLVIRRSENQTGDV